MIAVYIVVPIPLLQAAAGVALSPVDHERPCLQDAMSAARRAAEVGDCPPPRQSTTLCRTARAKGGLLLPHLHDDVPRDLAALPRRARLHDALERKARADHVEQPPGLAEPQH